MMTTLRSKFSKASATLLLTVMFVQFAPSVAMAQYWSWWNLGWTSRTSYRPLLGGYRTAYYPTFAPRYVAPVAYDQCSTCQPACSTCYRPTYAYAPTTAYRPVTYYRPLSVPMVSYYQPGCNSCGSSCSPCGSGSNSCGTSGYAMQSSSCNGCSGGTTYPNASTYPNDAPSSNGHLAPVPSNSSQNFGPAPGNGSQTPQPSLAPSEAPRSIYAPPEGSSTRTFQKPLTEDSPTDIYNAAPALRSVPSPSAPSNPAGIYPPQDETPRLRPLPTPSSARGLFGRPSPAPLQDKTAASKRTVSRVTHASHTVTEPRRLPTTQEELDADGWRSAR